MAVWEYCAVNKFGKVVYFQEGGPKEDTRFETNSWSSGADDSVGWPRALAWLGQQGWEMAGAMSERENAGLSWYFKRCIG